MKKSQHSKAWSRWLHLDCGMPAEHVAHVLGLTPPDVESLANAPTGTLSDDELNRRRHLRSQGLTYTQIGNILGRSRHAISDSLNVPRPRLKRPPGPPLKRKRSVISGRPGTYVRTLRDLGYSAARISEFLAIEPSVVDDFLGRLEPRRRPRKNPDRNIRPRTHREERDARLAIQRAEERRQHWADEDRKRREDEQVARLRLHRSPEDAWGSRGTSTEIADYARLLEAMRKGQLSGAELLGLAARVYHAEPRNGPPEPEPVVWTGASDYHFTGPTALTAGQILEAADLLRAGATWAHVARRFGVSENTLRRYVKDIAPRRAGAQYPTTAARYAHGVVRWDLPLGITSDGTHRTVLVECECGRERRVWTSEITRPNSRFTGMCYPCFRRTFLDRGPVPLLCRDKPKTI